MNSSISENLEINGPQHKLHMDEAGAPPGVGSIMWDVITDISFGPLLLSVGAMQGALPAVSTAVEKTYTYKRYPQKRGQVSAASLGRFLYDGRKVAVNEAHDLRKLHANIKGKLDDGSSYYALNPATFRIVPDTFLDGIIRIREAIGKPLTQEELDQLYEEYAQLCLMFGIPRKYIPESLEAFNKTYGEIVSEQMQYTPAAKYIIEELSFYRSSKKVKNPIKKALIKYNNKHIAPAIDIGVRGSLHPVYREKFNIPWTAEDQQKFKALCEKIAKVQKYSPRFLRYPPRIHLLRLGVHGAKLPTAEEVRIKEEVRRRELEENNNKVF